MVLLWYVTVCMVHGVVEDVPERVELPRCEAERDNYLSCRRESTFGPARVLCGVTQVIAWYYRSSRVTDSLFILS